MLEYQLIKGLYLLKVASDRQGACVDNTFVCVGILLGVGVLPARAYQSMSMGFVIQYNISVIERQVLLVLEYRIDW